MDHYTQIILLRTVTVANFIYHYQIICERRILIQKTENRLENVLRMEG